MRQKKFILFLLTVLMAESCSVSHQLKSDDRVINGTIYSIGHEPFTKLGVQSSDGHMYTLKCTKEIEQLLNAKQGKQVTIHYEMIEQTPEGTTLLVKTIEE